MKIALTTAIALVALGSTAAPTGTAHAQDTLVTSRGVEWKCHDGIIVRFDSVGGKREEGASTTLIITGLPRLGPNGLHIVESKDSKRELRERLKGRSSFLLDGKRCTIQD
jgi:hypothetical protein